MSVRVVTGELVRIVDGDTAHFILSPGWGILLMPKLGEDPGYGTVRIVHEDGSSWDAPDLDTPAERNAAKEALATLLTVGKKYTIVSHTIEKYGRTLASIRLPDGRDVAATMVSMGHIKRRQP